MCRLLIKGNCTTRMSPKCYWKDLIFENNPDFCIVIVGQKDISVHQQGSPTRVSKLIFLMNWELDLNAIEERLEGNSLKIHSKGNRNHEIKTGTEMELWGTPQVRDAAAAVEYLHKYMSLDWKYTVGYLTYNLKWCTLVSESRKTAETSNS